MSSDNVYYTVWYKDSPTFSHIEAFPPDLDPRKPRDLEVYILDMPLEECLRYRGQRYQLLEIPGFKEDQSEEKTLSKLPMTQYTFCKQLLRRGVKEVHPNSDIAGARSFLYGAVKFGPECMCNDAPPSILVNTYPDFHVGGDLIEGTIEVEVFGEMYGIWSKHLVYAISRGAFFGRIDSLTAALGKAWGSFAGSMTASKGGTNG